MEVTLQKSDVGRTGQSSFLLSLQSTSLMTDIIIKDRDDCCPDAPNWAGKTSRRMKHVGIAVLKGIRDHAHHARYNCKQSCQLNDPTTTHAQGQDKLLTHRSVMNDCAHCTCNSSRSADRVVSLTSELSEHQAMLMELRSVRENMPSCCAIS